MAASWSAVSLAAAEADARARARPVVTVIIPTKDRPLELLQTARSLLAQTAPAAELVVVDQSASPAARAPLRRLLAAARKQGGAAPTCVYLHAPELTGCPAARNRGMAAAGGEIWQFLDDDVRLEPGFLAEILAAYRSEPRADGVAGVVTNYTAPSRAHRLWRRVFFVAPFADDRQPFYWRAARLRRAAPQPVSRLGGGLMSFRAERIRGLRFDDRLRGAGYGEDVDFCLRLPAPRRLLLAPRARLEHLRSLNNRPRAHWLELEAQGCWYLYAKHWRDQGLSGRFAWVRIGLAAAALLGCARRRTAEPWRALRRGAAAGRSLAEAPPRRDGGVSNEDGRGKGEGGGIAAGTGAPRVKTRR